MDDDNGFEKWSKAYGVAPLNSVPRTRELLGGCGHDYLYKLANTGKLTIRKLGSRSFVTGEEIFKLVRELPAAADVVQPHPGRPRQDAPAKDGAGGG